LIETYKIVTGKEKISSSQFFTPYASNYNTIGHSHNMTTTIYVTWIYERISSVRESYVHH